MHVQRTYALIAQQDEADQLGALGLKMEVAVAEPRRQHLYHRMEDHVTELPNVLTVVREPKELVDEAVVQQGARGVVRVALRAGELVVVVLSFDELAGLGQVRREVDAESAEILAKPGQEKKHIGTEDNHQHLILPDVYLHDIQKEAEVGYVAADAKQDVVEERRQVNGSIPKEHLPILMVQPVVRTVLLQHRQCTGASEIVGCDVESITHARIIPALLAPLLIGVVRADPVNYGRHHIDAVMLLGPPLIGAPVTGLAHERAEVVVLLVGLEGANLVDLILQILPAMIILGDQVRVRVIELELVGVAVVVDIGRPAFRQADENAEAIGVERELRLARLKASAEQLKGPLNRQHGLPVVENGVGLPVVPFEAFFDHSFLELRLQMLRKNIRANDIDHTLPI